MREKLAKLGWSQAELGRRLAVSGTTVTKWDRRGAPHGVEKFLEAMCRLQEAGEFIRSYVDQPAGRPRGRHGRPSEAVWERSATDAAPQQVDRGSYERKLDEWGEADLDQSEGWGEG